MQETQEYIVATEGGREVHDSYFAADTLTTLLREQFQGIFAIDVPQGDFELTPPQPSPHKRGPVPKNDQIGDAIREAIRQGKFIGPFPGTQQQPAPGSTPPPLPTTSQAPTPQSTSSANAEEARRAKQKAEHHKSPGQKEYKKAQRRGLI